MHARRQTRFPALLALIALAACSTVAEQGSRSPNAEEASAHHGTTGTSSGVTLVTNAARDSARGSVSDADAHQATSPQGGTTDVDRELAWQHLVAGVQQLHERITPLGVRIAFEPEPGHFVSSLGDWERLRDAVSLPDFGLALDVGHVPCTEPITAGDAIRRYAAAVRTVHLDDSKNGVHEHLQIGDGSLDWPDIMHALREIGFTGIASVELSRHSHAAPEAARVAFERLSAAMSGSGPEGAARGL